MRVAVLGVMPAAKRTLDSGYRPEVRGVPLKSWRCLLHLLSSVASMQSDTETLLRVSNDLLGIADHMAPPTKCCARARKFWSTPCMPKCTSAASGIPRANG